MKPILAFDVYGTLVDPMGMADLLAPDAGDAAESVSAQWREKQLEFSFRKGLMRMISTLVASAPQSRAGKISRGDIRSARASSSRRSSGSACCLS